MVNCQTTCQHGVTSAIIRTSLSQGQQIAPFIIQQYKISEENAESWDEDQIEAWEHDRWLLMQELGDNFYKLHNRDNHDSEVDPFEEEERVKWQEEEERAKASFF